MFLFFSERRTQSIIDETDLNGETMTREVQLSPPTTPSTTTIRQNHDTCSFFGRRRRHHHHHRSTTRSRRNEFVTTTSGRPVIITDETRRPMLSSTDTTPQDQQNPHQDHQIRIKHRSMKGQTYRLKILNRQFSVPFDRLWLLTVFDRFVLLNLEFDILFCLFCFDVRCFSDRSIGECFLCIILAIFVSIVGIQVLINEIYYDLEVLIFCCVIAASQYSLLKSCQPDVNTPVHVKRIDSSNWIWNDLTFS